MARTRQDVRVHGAHQAECARAWCAQGRTRVCMVRTRQDGKHAVLPAIAVGYQPGRLCA